MGYQVHMSTNTELYTKLSLYVSQCIVLFCCMGRQKRKIGKSFSRFAYYQRWYLQITTSTFHSYMLSWFPGYAWTITYCRSCFQHLVSYLIILILQMFAWCFVLSHHWPQSPSWRVGNLPFHRIECKDVTRIYPDIFGVSHIPQYM